MMYRQYEFNKQDAYDFARFIGIQVHENNGQLHFRKCPYCQQLTNDKNTFAISLTTGQFKCLRDSCGASGNMIILSRDFGFRLGNEEYYVPKQKYRTLPTPAKPIEPKDKAIEYLKSRGISEKIARQYEITVQKDRDNVLVFPFYDEAGNLTFVKYRKTDFDKEKDQNKEWCEAQTKPILFGMKQCNMNHKTLIITEGQLDSLSVAEAGFQNAVSVPTGSKGMTWIPHCWDFVNQFEVIIVFGDYEKGHISLLDEISKRFKKHIKHVREEDYKDCKDANEILQKYTKAQIKVCITNAVDVPVQHTISLADVEEVNPFDIEKLPTGFKELDQILYGGLPFGGITLMTGKAGCGKLLADDTPVFTSEGWKRHGDLVIGDRVIGRNGNFVKVTHVFPKQYANMEVELSTGEKIKCHENHEWVLDLHSQNTYKEKILTAKEIYEKKKARYYHPVRLIRREPLNGETKELFVKPYTFGAWLGDGRNGDPDICSSKEDYCVIESVINDDGYKIAWQTTHKTTGVIYTSFVGLRQGLQKYGMCHSRKRVEKYIPVEYLTASLDQKLELLAGLLDTDGHYDDSKGAYIYSTSDETLRDSFIDLIHIFGWTTWCITRKAQVSSSGIHGRKDNHCIGFIPRMVIPCRVERKRNTVSEKHRGWRVNIKNIDYCEPVQGNCIEVEGGVYCVGKSMQPTHNSTVASQIVINAMENGHRCFCYSGELPNHLFKSWMNFQVAGASHIFEYQNRWGDKGYNITDANKKLISQWYKDKIDIYDNTSLDDSEDTSIIRIIEDMINRYLVDVILLDNLMTALDLDTIRESDKYEKQSRFLKKLTRITLKYKVLIILVAHKRKNNFSKNANDEISGSSDISNLASVVLGYDKDDDLQEEQRMLTLSKNRLFGKTGSWIMEYDERSKRVYGERDDVNKEYSWNKSGWEDSTDYPFS